MIKRVKRIALIAMLLVLVCMLGYTRGKVEATSTTGTYNDLLNYSIENEEVTITGVTNYNETEITIPDKIDGKNVTKIGQSAFYYCSSLQSITIPNTVTKIDWNAFEECKQLKGITLPTGLTSLGGKAFLNCSSLKSIEIPTGVEQITTDTFRGCSSIETINITGSKTKMTIEEVSIFGGCDSLISINVNENNEKFASIDGVLFDKYIQKLYIYPSAKKDKEYTIPSTVIRLYSAFENCKYLETLNIPSKVQYISQDGLQGIKNFVVDNNNANFASEDGILYDKGKTTLLKYPTGRTDESYTVKKGITKLDGYSFAYANNLNSIEISDSVSKVGYCAFLRCKNLKNIKIPNSVKEISGATFQECTGLESIQIPNGITTISSEMFNDCTNLKTVSIPNNITAIGERAFAYCNNLENINIPQSVTNIGNGAFYVCTSLKKISIPSTTKIETSAFWQCDKDKLIFVVVKGSDAEKYAKDNNIKCEYVEQTSGNTTGGSTNPNTTVTNTSSKFKVGKDSNSFGHHNNSDIMTNAGFVGMKDFSLDNSYFNKLVKYSSDGEKSYIKKMMKYGDGGSGFMYDIAGGIATVLKPFGLFTAWNGECYGIATAMGMAYEGHVKLNDLSSKKVSNFNTLPYPNKDNKLKNVMHYFYLSQYLEKGGKEYASFLSTRKAGKTDKDIDLSVFLKKLVETAKNGHVTVFGYENDEYGHTILLTGYENVKENEPYKIRFFDENSVHIYTKKYIEDSKKEGKTRTNSNGKFSYMTVSRDYSTFELKNADGEVELNNNNLGRMALLNYSKMKKLDGSVDSATAKSGTKTDGKVTIQVPVQKNLTIVNSSGKTLYYDGTKFTGSMKMYSINRVQNVAMGATGATEMAQIKVDPSDNFKVKGSSKISVDVYNESDYVCLMANNITGADLSLKNGISLDGKNYSFEAFISANEKVATNEKNLVSVVAQGSGKTKIAKQSQKIKVNANSGLKNTYISNYVGTKVAVQKYDKTVKTATVGNILKEHAHNYKMTGNNGQKITCKCKICGETKTITAKLDKTSHTYDGKAKKPKVKILDSKNKAIASSNYKISYAKGRKNVGEYNVKITFKGNFSGSKTLKFTIIPKNTSISNLKAGKKKMTVKWKKQTKQTKGYQIQYATNKNFKSSKNVNIKKNKTTKKTIKKLKKKKTYYVRIRTYKTVKVNGKSKTLYSSWSKVKKVKIK